ncbi:2-ketoisovalerate ferredoxin oxidoreductase [Methanomassiliicoccales archaeon RumEn M1]|jgi:pyruvate ferredoxin oxidoreductase beta subunit|nr:2-ketoisovalerate ferredoxin oxidoreductase [Methanomassiliicoccales archaeon RumEn M1]
MTSVRSPVAGLRNVSREDMLVHGHGACPGCGYAVTARNIAKVLGPQTVVYVPASCLTVFSATYPKSAWRIPFLYTAFENTGAIITGLKAAYRRRGIEANVVGMAGDGGSFDIGLQALSGAAERNEDVIYVCLDNEAYMNTGIQRSSATPFGAWTTTTPAGLEIQGNRRFKKDLAAIVAQHDVPYVATLSVAHFTDFVKKVEKAKSMSGFRFLHCLTPCIPGWRIEPSRGVSIDRLAVETGMWTLYEVEHGVPRVTYRPRKMLPVTEYLGLQGRFKHISEEDVRTLQSWLCRKWKAHYGEEVEEPPCVIARKDEGLGHDGDPLHGL